LAILSLNRRGSVRRARSTRASNSLWVTAL
jgi:hypothetical protein